MRHLVRRFFSHYTMKKGMFVTYKLSNRSTRPRLCSALSCEDSFVCFLCVSVLVWFSLYYSEGAVSCAHCSKGWPLNNKINYGLILFSVIHVVLGTWNETITEVGLSLELGWNQLLFIQTLLSKGQSIINFEPRGDNMQIQRCLHCILITQWKQAGRKTPWAALWWSGWAVIMTLQSKSCGSLTSPLFVFDWESEKAAKQDLQVQPL